MEETSNFHVHKYVDHDEMYLKGIPLETIGMSIGLARRLPWIGWKLWPNNLKRPFISTICNMYVPTYIFIPYTYKQYALSFRYLLNFSMSRSILFTHCTCAQHLLQNLSGCPGTRGNHSKKGPHVYWVYKMESFKALELWRSVFFEPLKVEQISYVYLKRKKALKYGI